MTGERDKCIGPGAKRLIVLDFDGVVADSEMLANEVLAQFVTELGVPMTTQDSIEAFAGKRADEVMAKVGAITGRRVDADLEAEFFDRTLARFRSDLREVRGVRAYLDTFRHVERCIASSSSPERLAACLEVLGLADAFGAHVYSASCVARGKPHPDLFLHVAAQFGVAPAQAIVIEDGEAGIRGALAAGMTPIGLLAASHIGPDHEARLRRAGARYIAHDCNELAAITHRLLS
ncbi:MAG TPA: HAD-IA family hydrolase [Casimicrobiaceae bacterium]|nr:HAD-IA family hydrolase [Casimicrobiaceae bacterium]